MIAKARKGARVCIESEIGKVVAVMSLSGAITLMLSLQKAIGTASAELDRRSSRTALEPIRPMPKEVTRELLK